MIDEKRKQEIKDRYVLNNIKKGVENVMGTSIRHIYKNSDVGEKYNKMLQEIFKIEFPVFLTKWRGG